MTGPRVVIVGGGSSQWVPNASQELTVEAALSGSRDLVVEAMRADPLRSRLDADAIAGMAADLIDATQPWLPQFARA
ncbi:MAG: hypothetical protein WDA60_08070 [Acidimicrobiia bacterium]